MSNFFSRVVGSASTAQFERLKASKEKAILPQPVQIGAVTGFDSNTGEYQVTTADGGIQPAKLGNFGTPPNQVSLSITQNAYTVFADFRAPQ